MPPSGQLLSLRAAATLRAAIADARGNEVFALGRRDPESPVYTEVLIVARGHESAVPAITKLAEYGDVAIHNHPSGILRPSEPDMAIAHRLAQEGIAFAIVDNPVSEAYVVVEPFSDDQRPQNVDPGQAAHILGPDGPIARHLGAYEHRETQQHMASAVVGSLNDDGIAVLEAGTGTGKSLAYLVPAALWAGRNKERVLVATGTIHLQEQLVSKDLPLLKEALDLPIEVALVKGRGNYLGLRRLGLALEGQESLVTDDQRRMLQDIASWAERTTDGSLQDLPFRPPDSIWSEINSDGDACLRLRCPHYQECFYFKSRRQASRAGILVANHHLFFADVSVRSATANWDGAALLPPYKRVVLDEAHKLEGAASSFFGTQATRRGVLRALGRLSRADSRKRAGLLSTIADRLTQLRSPLAEKLDDVILPEVAYLRQRTDAAFDALQQWVDQAGEAGERGTLRITTALCERAPWGDVARHCEGLSEDLRRLAGRLEEIASGLDKLATEREDSSLDGLRIELGAAGRRLLAAGNNLVTFSGFDESGATDDGLVRWFDWSRAGRQPTLRLQAAPLEVAESLHGQVWQRFPSHVLTSATLATGRGGPKAFDYVAQRLGLDQVMPERVEREQFPSPFDFANQAVVLVRNDLPDPNRLEFADRCAEAVLESVSITRGRAFVLFTSYALLRRIGDRIAGRLARQRIPLLRQGTTSRSALLERFKAEVGSVLLGTDSFWEGVDVRGEALQSVIITRLPFRVPTEPLVEARHEAIAARGGNAFSEVTIPEAVIKFKQGFGRLIRHQADRGSVLILDNRAVNRGYGRKFLDALPAGVPVVAGGADEVNQRLKAFHDPL